MVDKETLLARLDQMLHLPENWDGYGTGPIDQRVHRVAKRLIAYIREDLPQFHIFVGVNMPGSLFADFNLLGRRVEMTITTDGTIHYDEIVAGVEVGSGIFLLSKRKLDEIINQ